MKSELDDLFDALRDHIEGLEEALERKRVPPDGGFFQMDAALTNIKERLSHMEQVVMTYMSQSTKQWTEERLRALELQVKELRHGKGPKADRVSYVENELPGDYVPVDITAAIESDLRKVRLDKGEVGPEPDADASDGHQR